MMRPSAVGAGILALLLGAGTTTAQEVARPGPPAADDFETDRDGDGVPDGWYNLRDATLVKGGGIVGPTLLRFVSARPGRQARASRAFGVDGRKTEALIVGLWVKAEGLRTGERLGEDASLQIDFLGESLTATGRGLLGPWTDSTGRGWVHVVRRIAVAPGTRDAILTVGLLGAMGTLQIDGLTIEEVPVGGSATTDLILNGGFELGNPAPPFWTLEEEARRAFPGYRSDAALELSGAGSKALNGLGVRADRLPNLEVRLVAKGSGLRRTGGARAAVFFLDADGRALPPPDDGASLFRWTGTFDWKEERGTVRVPTSAARAVLQIETLDSGGNLKIDDVSVRAAPDAEVGRWTPYHVEIDTDGWKAFEPSRAIAKGSPLDASTLLEAPAGKRGAVAVKDGHLHFADGSRARFFGAVILPPLAFADAETADALADRLARSGVNLARFDALDAPFGPGQSLFDDGRDDTLALDPDSLAKFDHLVAALKSRGIYVAIELLNARRFREGDGLPGWSDLPPGGGPAAAFDPKVRDLTIAAADQWLGHVNPETKLPLRDDPALAWVTIAGELSLFDRIESPGSPASSESALKELSRKFGAGRKGWGAIEANQWKGIADALRKAGLKRPIAGSSHWRREPEFVAAQGGAGLDLIDDRLFWAAPRFGTPERRSMLWKAAGTLATESARKRKADRPYVAGEWGAHTEGAWALPYEGADLLLAARIAGAEDWDALVRRGILRFPVEWGAAPAGTGGGQDTFLAPEVVNANPQVFALLPHAASLYLREGHEAGRARKGVGSWDAAHGRLTIDTPHTQGIAGPFRGKPAKLDAVAIEADGPYAVVVASSLGSEPLASSRRMLVTAVGRVAPTGLLYADQWRREVASPGGGPILVEPVRGRVTIRRRGKVRVYALRPDGSRGAEVATRSSGDGTSFDMDSGRAVLHWEVVVE